MKFELFIIGLFVGLGLLIFTTVFGVVVVLVIGHTITMEV